MPTLFDPKNEGSIRARVARLTPDAPARWGRMNARQMLCHLTDGFRVALGEAPVTPKGGPLTFGPLRWLVVYALPWPKGKLPTSPEFLASTPEDWTADLARWSAGCDRFVARARSPEPNFGVHPAFGRLAPSEWGRLISLHSDHHLRQFGV